MTTNQKIQFETDVLYPLPASASHESGTLRYYSAQTVPHDEWNLPTQQILNKCCRLVLDEAGWVLPDGTPIVLMFTSQPSVSGCRADPSQFMYAGLIALYRWALAEDPSLRERAYREHMSNLILNRYWPDWSCRKPEFYYDVLIADPHGYRICGRRPIP